MALLAKQQIINTGLVPAYSAAAGGGDTFNPGDNTFLHAKNASGAPITVTVDSKTPSNFGTDVDLVVAVAAGSERMIGPLPASRFQDPTTGLGNVTYSGVTSLTVAVLAI